MFSSLFVQSLRAPAARSSSQPIHCQKRHESMHTNSVVHDIICHCVTPCLWGSSSQLLSLSLIYMPAILSASSSAVGLDFILIINNMQFSCYISRC
mmetsp:Transcript_10795/g.15009  ORF Transcript_10795/g.15009 Transcript_10795/m.15009 type:complete len:96 (-) Transcript_10795:832-1119(-)